MKNLLHTEPLFETMTLNAVLPTLPIFTESRESLKELQIKNFN